MGLAAALALAALALAAPAQAQVVRSFTPRFSISTTGDITLLGNTLMSCSGNGQCAKGQGGTGNSIDDNDFNMVYVDVDADATTFCSSTSDLALPAGATVLWAGLYWGGDSNNAARNQCKFGTPAAGYATQTATQTDVSTTTRYSCFKDVTTLVQAAGNGTYKVANVQSTPGSSDVYAGWSLVVVYKDPTQVNRNLVVEDGYALVDGPTVNFTVSGFLTPLAGPVQTRMGVVAYEGDLGLTGDSFSLNGAVLSDAANPATNFFNSTVSKFGANVTTRNPNYGNQLGFDADLMNANGVLANGSTSAAIALTTNGDTYYPAVVTFATDLYAPVIEGTSFFKSVTDLNGGAPRPGDVLEYAVRMQNTGQDGASNVVFRDTLASNLTYVPGSRKHRQRAECRHQDRRHRRRPGRLVRGDPHPRGAARHGGGHVRGGRAVAGRADDRQVPRHDHRPRPHRHDRVEPGGLRVQRPAAGHRVRHAQRRRLGHRRVPGDERHRDGAHDLGHRVRGRELRRRRRAHEGCVGGRRATERARRALRRVGHAARRDDDRRHGRVRVRRLVAGHVHGARRRRDRAQLAARRGGDAPRRADVPHRRLDGRRRRRPGARGRRDAVAAPTRARTSPTSRSPPSPPRPRRRSRSPRSRSRRATLRAWTSASTTTPSST